MTSDNEQSIWRYVKRFIITLTLLILFLGFLVWRTNNPRLESLRLDLSDRLPNFNNIFAPLSRLGGVATRFQSYEQLLRENDELREKLRERDQWRELALQLEQTNAELRALNKLKYVPDQSFITGEISSDTGGNFSHSALLNVGRDKGVKVGAPVLDSLGLIGRVVAVGDKNARILLLSDPQNQISVTIMPDRIRAIVAGNGTAYLDLNLIDTSQRLLAGSRVVTSGDGILPPELPIGRIVIDKEGHSSVRLAADYDALDFVRVLFDRPKPEIDPDVPLVETNDTSDPETD